MATAQQVEEVQVAVPISRRGSGIAGWLGYGWYLLRRYPVLPGFILFWLLLAAIAGPWFSPYDRDIGIIQDRHLPVFTTGAMDIDRLSGRRPDSLDPGQAVEPVQERPGQRDADLERVGRAEKQGLAGPGGRPEDRARAHDEQQPAGQDRTAGDPASGGREGSGGSSARAIGRRSVRRASGAGHEHGEPVRVSA